MSVIDETALTQLRALIGNDEDALSDLAGTFLEEGEEIVGHLATAVSSKDRELLKRSAHSLKSSSFDFGAMELGKTCAALEQASREDWPSSAPDDVDAIKTLWTSARDELRQKFPG